MTKLIDILVDVDDDIESRGQAKRLIHQGCIRVNGRIVRDMAFEPIDDNLKITVVKKIHWVRNK